MHTNLEATRLELSRSTVSEKKALLGQFLTPSTTASFMASLFTNRTGSCRLLDAGAGIGSLSAAFLDHWHSGAFGFTTVALDAFEIDPALNPHLHETLAKFVGIAGFSSNVRSDDFVRMAVDTLTGTLFRQPLGPYTHTILNPPYKKIHSGSAYRADLRRAGIETVNLYSAFVALAVALSAPKGQVVAIVPRSFCNGPYYRPFRDFILDRSALSHIHLFDSRTKAFREDNVLQENVILRLVCGSAQTSVTVSTSTDDTFDDLTIRHYSFDEIVQPGDHERFIHVPTDQITRARVYPQAARFTLQDLGLQVSTGPVVDFRLKEHLRAMPGPGTVPLLYPTHFTASLGSWPLPRAKKPNAIVANADTAKWLYPMGYYCVVRRFSSKEERRRVVANVFDPRFFENASLVGFENHLNVFHQKRSGLPMAVAFGLSTFLNATAVDEHFRRFSGHTQVNATDLRQLKYPSLSALTTLGEWAMEATDLSQTAIDAKVGAVSQ